MDDTVLLIRSSSHPDEPYKMRFTALGDIIRLRCYCPAGAEQMLCKHVLSLLTGDREQIFDARQTALFDEAVAAAERMGAVKYCREMDNKIAEMKRLLDAARRQL